MFEKTMENLVAAEAKAKKEGTTKKSELMDKLAVMMEARNTVQKLLEAKPETIGQASRIPGVTPAAISILLIHLKKRSLQDKISA